MDDYFPCNYVEGTITCTFISTSEANMLSASVLKTNPLFDKNPAHGPILFTDHIVKLTEAKQVELLANEIPALTFATGHRGAFAFPDKNNVDIRFKYLQQGNKAWPRKPLNNYEWRHSDLYNVAYPYVYGLYDDWVKLIKGVPLQ